MSISIDIDTAPQRVWAVMSDVERWPEWTASVTRVEWLDAGTMAVGSRARILQPKLPPAVWQVTVLDAGASFTWVSKAPGVAVTARHSIESRGSGTRATLSLHFGGLLGGIWARVTGGITERYLKLEAAGLKVRSEGV